MNLYYIIKLLIIIIFALKIQHNISKRLLGFGYDFYLEIKKKHKKQIIKNPEQRPTPIHLNTLFFFLFGLIGLITAKLIKAPDINPPLYFYNNIKTNYFDFNFKYYIIINKYKWPCQSVTP